MAVVKIPQHITDLKKSDFEEIARATNLQSGVGITVVPTGKGFKISINEAQLKQMLWAFNANGGFAVRAAEVEEVPFDPPS